MDMQLSLTWAETTIKVRLKEFALIVKDAPPFLKPPTWTKVEALLQSILYAYME